ncbi:MAG: hypothetical protein KGI38_12080 [Thaumarchaeota archaeon]|nr:hypothetical protein [Nitrososphaerota archaeon]
MPEPKRKPVLFKPSATDEEKLRQIMQEYGVNRQDAFRIALLKWKKPGSDAEKVSDYEALMKLKRD